MCEKLLTYDNKLVLEILVEACRPRTREQCAKEFIMFLSVAIPQKFKINADNFYEPMMKLLHDLDHLFALFMKDSSILTQNKATVPVEETIPVLFKSGSFLWAFKKKRFYSY